MLSRKGVAHFSAGFLATMLIVGCSSTYKAPGAKMVESFQRTQISVMNAEQQVDVILSAMDQFQYTGNLSNAFQNYKAAVEKLEKQGDEAKKRAEIMREKMPGYIETWQHDVEKIQDPNVRASMEARREAVSKNFQTVRAAAEGVRDAYLPFLQENKDIVSALSVNLAPATAAAMKPAMDKAHKDGQVLKEKLMVLQKELNNIANGMPPGGQMAPAK